MYSRGVSISRPLDNKWSWSVSSACPRPNCFFDVSKGCVKLLLLLDLSRIARMYGIISHATKVSTRLCAGNEMLSLRKLAPVSQRSSLARLDVEEEAEVGREQSTDRRSQLRECGQCARLTGVRNRKRPLRLGQTSEESIWLDSREAEQSGKNILVEIENFSRNHKHGFTAFRPGERREFNLRRIHPEFSAPFVNQSSVLPLSQ